jgi:hypothetical protein
MTCSLRADVLATSGGADLQSRGQRRTRCHCVPEVTRRRRRRGARPSPKHEDEATTRFLAVTGLATGNVAFAGTSSHRRVRPRRRRSIRRLRGGIRLWLLALNWGASRRGCLAIPNLGRDLVASCVRDSCLPTIGTYAAPSQAMMRAHRRSAGPACREGSGLRRGRPGSAAGCP